MPPVESQSPEPAEPAARGDRKATLTALAADHFLARGYAGTSMNDIAVAAGIRKAALYHHFPSKEALFVAAITTELVDSAAELRALADDPALGHEDRVRRAMEVIYRGVVLSAAGRMAPVVCETARLVPEVALGFHDSFIGAMKQVMRDIVDMGVADAAFRAVDPSGLYHITFGPPVNLAISRAMFCDIPAAQDDLDYGTALARHTEMMLTLLKV